MEPLFPLRSAAAILLGRYFMAFAKDSTFLRVSGLTLSLSLNTLEMVAKETPAALASSFIFAISKGLGSDSQKIVIKAVSISQ